MKLAIPLLWGLMLLILPFQAQASEYSLTIARQG